MAAPSKAIANDERTHHDHATGVSSLSQPTAENANATTTPTINMIASVENNMRRSAGNLRPVCISMEGKRKAMSCQNGVRFSFAARIHVPLTRVSPFAMRVPAFDPMRARLQVIGLTALNEWIIYREMIPAPVLW